MKTSKLFLAIITIMVAFGCAKIETPNTSTIPRNDKGEYAIVFNNSSVVTKAVASSTSKWHYDDFSLYTWNSNNEVIMSPFTVVATGTDSYDYDGVGTQTRQYFKNNADSYSFIGVIPKTNATLNNGSVTVGVESFVVDDNRVSGTLAADSPKEFLWARADVAKGNYNQPVNLPFQHGNALLYLGFISDDGNTQIIDYTPHVDAQPAQPAVPGTVSTETISTKALDALRDGYIVGWPYANNVQPSTSNGNPRFTINTFGGMTDEIAEQVNSQFVYYTDAEGTTVKNDIFTATDVSIKNKVYIKLADGVNGQDLIDGNDAFWNNASETLKTDGRIKKCYDDGWRVVKIDKSFGQWTLWFLSNIPQNISVTTITGGSPAVPAVPESGFKGIRVFSAKADATDGYAHLAHTKIADATVATGLTFDNRVAVNDSIQFSLPGVIVPAVTAGTTEAQAEAQAIYSPTTFYAIPGDAGLTHFVVKLSYIYKGVKVYDVRVPLPLPAGLEAGKYYKYIIKITSIGNGTNDPDEANNEKDDIDIVENPIRVNVTITDYEKGHTEIITI